MPATVSSTKLRNLATPTSNASMPLFGSRRSRNMPSTTCRRVYRDAAPGGSFGASCASNCASRGASDDHANPWCGADDPARVRRSPPGAATVVPPAPAPAPADAATPSSSSDASPRRASNASMSSLLDAASNTSLACVHASSESPRFFRRWTTRESTDSTRTFCVPAASRSLLPRWGRDVCSPACTGSRSGVSPSVSVSSVSHTDVNVARWCGDVVGCALGAVMAVPQPALPNPVAICERAGETRREQPMYWAQRTSPKFVRGEVLDCSCCCCSCG